MHCLVFTDTDLYSLTKGKSYLAKQKWRRSTCLRDQCYDVDCHPCKLFLCTTASHFRSWQFSNGIINKSPDKSALLNFIFLISQPKHMLWVLKRIVSI